MSNQYADIRFVVSSRSSRNAPPQGQSGVTMCPVLTLICYHCQDVEQCEIIFHHLTKLHAFMANVENVL